MEELSEAEREDLIVISSTHVKKISSHLFKFRQKVEDILLDEYTKSDDFLIRWLRARNSNQRQAEEMLRNHFYWRKKQDIDRVLDLPQDPYFMENYPYDLDGVALNGGPVLCFAVRNWDIRKVVWDDKIPQFQQHHINRILERISAKIQAYNESRGPGEKATGFTAIVNWEGFSIFQMTSIRGVQALLNAVATYEAHYPETLSAAFYININYVFQMFFRLLKPILAPKTLSKLSFYGSNRSEWEPAVRAAVEANQISYEYGGLVDRSTPEI